MALTTVTGSLVSVNAIQGTLIADNAITAVHIATNAVSGTLIADNAVTAVHIAQNTITVTQLADDCVESDKIADGIITTNHLNKAMISSQTEVSAASGDFVLLGDTSDSNNLKKTPVSSIIGLASGTTINNNADNRVITGSGTANTLEGESGLTYDGTTLQVQSGGNNRFKVNNSGASVESGHLYFNAGTGNLGNKYIFVNGGSTNDGGFLFQRENANTWQIAPDPGSDNDLNFYSYGTNSTVLKIDKSTGNVGIGATTIDEKIHVEVSSGDAAIKLEDASGDYIRIDQNSVGANDKIRFKSGSSLTERMRIDSSGSLGVGTTNPGSLLHVAHSNGGTNPTARIENTTGTVAANSILLDLKFSGDDSFSNCDYIRFQDSSGEEGVITGDGGSRVYYEINSDYRLKENITSYSGGLNIIKALSVKRYNYIKSPGTNYTGFLAHEVAEVVDGVARGVKDATEVLSNVVLNHNSVVIAQGVTETEWTDGKTSEKYASNTTWHASHTRNINQGLDLSKLVPDLVSAIQEQQTIIDDLKSRIETLEG